MRLRSTMALAGVAGLLVAVLVLTDERPDETGSVEVPALANHRLGRAVVLRWRVEDRQPIELRREPGGEFWITEPVRDLASAPALLSIAQAYDSAMLGETPLEDTPENRARTGLDAPRVELEAVFADGVEERLLIGDEAPTGGVFVLRNGRILRGGMALYSSLEQKPLDQMRSRQVFRTPAAIAREVEVELTTEGGATELLRLARDRDGWRLTAPIESRADGDAVHGFVEVLLSLEISLFPNSPIRFPDRAPDLVVRVRGGPEEEIVRLWRDEQDNLLGRLEGRGVHFVSENRQYYKIFENAADHLRARILVPANVHQDLEVVSVDSGQGPRIVLQRPAGNSPWEMTEPMAGAVEATPVNELLTAINNLRAIGFFRGGAGEERYGFGEADLRVGTKTFTARDPQFVRFGRDDVADGLEITYAARADAEDDVVSVPRGAVDVIRRPWSAYVSRDILRLPHAVTRVVLERRTGEQHTLARDEQGEWRTQDGAPRELVPDMVDRLRDLRGQRALLRREQQFGEPDWTVELGRVGRPEPYARLEVWERGPLPLLARGAGNPDLVFELSPFDSKLLRDLWQ